MGQKPSPLPLEILARALDPAGQDLAIAPAPQLGGRSNATWNSPGPFPPGRLDHLLFSRSLLELRGSFAFDPGELTPEGRRALGLQEGDEVDARPHLFARELTVGNICQRRGRTGARGIGKRETYLASRMPPTSLYQP